MPLKKLSKKEVKQHHKPWIIIGIRKSIERRRKRLFPSKYVKYLGILTDSYLNWSYHTDMLASKLTRAIGMLSKIRHFVPKGTLHEIYYGISSSILTFKINT